MSKSFSLGEEVLHNGKQGRVVATSGDDQQCIVRYEDDTLSKGANGKSWVPMSSLQPTVK